MKIKTLQLDNFRNYASQSFSFDEGLNVIYGKNGAGKTNVLESVYLLSLFNSPRTARDKELVKFGTEKARIKAVIERKYGRRTVLLQIDSAGKKKALVDGLPVKRAAELIGVLGVVFFSPDEMRLVKETPAERRRFLDVGLSQQQKSYFIALSRYNKTLKQKNNLLKDVRYAAGTDDMLSVWDAQLAEYGAAVTAARKKYVAELNSAASKIHSYISGDKEELVLGYESASVSDDEKEIRTELAEKITAAREKDKQLGFCTVGPHRDDISIKINSLDGRKFASQGQQRTIALAMKLAEVELYEKESGDRPVLLLDDVLSELDENRQKVLLQLTRGAQTLLTCTEYYAGGNAKKIRVEEGRADEDK